MRTLFVDIEGNLDFSGLDDIERHLFSQMRKIQPPSYEVFGWYAEALGFSIQVEERLIEPLFNDPFEWSESIPEAVYKETPEPEPTENNLVVIQLRSVAIPYGREFEYIHLPDLPYHPCRMHQDFLDFFNIDRKFERTDDGMVVVRCGRYVRLDQELAEVRKKAIVEMCHRIGYRARVDIAPYDDPDKRLKYPQY